MNQNSKDLTIGSLIFIFYVLISYFFWKNNAWMTLILGVLSFFILFKWTNTEEKFIYFTSFLLGPLIDLTIVPTGIWVYGNPTIFNIPMWLPFTYGIAGVLLVKMGKSIAEIFSKK